MAGIPPPRLRVSRSGLYDSQQDNYPSDFLHDSAQLQEISAPFMNQPSMEDSLWPSQAAQHSDEEVEEYIQHSSYSATPGPPTRTAGAASFPHLRGGNNNSSSGNNASPAAALKDLVKRLGNSSNNNTPTASRPSPPPPRSEADSDILDSDGEYHDGKQMHSIRTTFRQAAGQIGNGSQNDSEVVDLATPKQTHHASKIPTSGGRPKQRRLSLERSTATKATGFRTSYSDDEARDEAEVSKIASSAVDRSNSRSFGDDEAQDEAEVSRIASSAVDRSNSKSFEALQARLDSSNLDDYLPSSEGGFSPPGSPRVENLNESAVDLTAGQEIAFPQQTVREEMSFGDPRSPSPIPFVRHRTTSASGIGRPRSSLSMRQRPVSSFGREFGEISFPSAEVDSSTPIKTKTERQLDLQRSWGRASGPGFHPRSRTTSHGSMHGHSRSSSPALSLRRGDSREEARAPSPLQVWEKDRERSWNSPRPRELGARPHSPPREKRYSDGYLSGSTRSRTSSISSVASVDFRSKGKEREHSLNSPPPAPSPAPSSPANSPRRVRTISSPTAAEILHERERSWNRPQRTSQPTTPSHVHSSHAHSHSRTPAMSLTGLDSAIKSLRSETATPPPILNRSKSLGHSAGKTSPGGMANRPITPSASFGRRSSLIDAVKEETEPETSVASQPESEVAPSPPQVSVPRSTTPPLPQSGSETSSLAESEEQKGSQSEHSEREKKPSLTSRFSFKKDASRLKKLFSVRSKSPAPQSTTTPQSSPPRPNATDPEPTQVQEPEPPSTTPQTSPAKPRDVPPPTNLVTPTKRPFHEFPATLPTPSPPKGGLPELPSPSESDDEEEAQRKSVAEVSRIAPVNLFGASRYLPKTPKFPGAWGTPGTVAKPASPPPFDDREHPHPKGKALEALKLKPEDGIPSDSDASTPVVRPMEVPPEPASEPPQEEQAPQDDADAESSEIIEVIERVMTPPPEAGAVSKVEPKTPYPPGGWGRTPSQRKSILKVRFEPPGKSPGRPTSHPPTPDEVREKGFKLLEGLGGLMADEGYGSIGKSAQQPVSSTPSRGSNISMVDGLGRQLYAASDGAFIQRLDQRTRTMSDSAQSSSSIGMDDTPSRKPTSTAVEIHVTEPHKRPQAFSGWRADSDVSLNSPQTQRQQGHESHSDGDSDDSPYPTRLRVKRIRHAIDHVRRETSGSSSFDEGEPSLEQRLELDYDMNQTKERSLKAQTERRHLERQFAASSQGSTRQSRPPRTLRQPKTVTSSISRVLSSLLTVKWTLFIFAQIIILWFMLEFAKRHAENLFYTTHYDPTWAGYHDSGDPHAPTASQWLMLGRDAASAAAWFDDFLYQYFGVRRGQTTLSPHRMPT
ncbi:hypothetical protein FRB90_003905 [Tulasnella sp. 427]|nr:hypothetical protein FRB90_003905 [Tulasnella sp. 427]